MRREYTDLGGLPILPDDMSAAFSAVELTEDMLETCIGPRRMEYPGYVWTLLKQMQDLDKWAACSSCITLGERFHPA